METPELEIENAPLRINEDTKQPISRHAGRLIRIGWILLAIAVADAVAWQIVRTKGASGEATAGESAAAAVPVTFETVIPRKLRLWNSYSGRLSAVDSADIRPEVSGRITEVRFKEGQAVKAGDILLVIEPQPFEAEVAHAEAEIASAKANLQFAALDEERDTALLRERVIAQREFDETDSHDKVAESALLTAQADLKTAQVDLDHAYIKAPISGRVGRAELTVGNLVESGAGIIPPLLTTIVSEAPIYADFEVDEQTYLDTIRNAANGNAQEQSIPVELAVEGGGGRIYKGFIQNFDNRLDTESGTIRARAKFDNADQSLVPGMFVSVHLAGSREQSVLLIDDRAISFDQSKKFVYAISPENKAEYREVELGAEMGGQRVVLNGLQAGDRVVVDGIQRIHADATVNPTELPAAGDEPGRTAQTDGESGLKQDTQ